MKQKQDFPLKVRRATNEDIPFIFNSWLRSFRETGYLAHAITNTIFYENHHRLIQKILKRSWATTFVVCPEDHTNQILAYMVAERIDGVFVLHYVYTKHTFRKMGLAKSLLNNFDHDTTFASCCSHLTKIAERFLMKYNMIYHPYVTLLDYEVPSDAEPLEIPKQVEE